MTETPLASGSRPSGRVVALSLRMLRRLVAVVVLILASAAGATTMRALSTEELFAKSDIIAVVQIRDVQTVRAGGRLVTHVAAEISERFKGAAAAAALTILTLGGTDGQLGQRVEGAAQFSAGETCVVFLTRVTDGVYHVTGMEQGKLGLEPDSSGVLRIHRTQTAHVVTPAPAGGWEDAAPLPVTEPAEPFFATLRQLAGGAR